MNKTTLPSIDNELSPVSRPRVDLKNLRPREPMTDADIAANSRAIGEKWGASIQLPAVEPIVPLSPVVSIRGYIPQYLDDELAMKAAGRRVTKTFLLLEALQKAGYHVEEFDMIEDRRKSKQRGREQ
jgi:hypothetical protein